MTTEQQAPEKLSPYDHRNAALIAGRLTRRDITTGDIAGLRRLNSRRPTEAAFWKICSDIGLGEIYDDDLLASWAIMVRIIASGTKVGDEDTTGPHNGNDYLGKILAQQGYSENRFKTLLNADEESLIPITERMCSFLHSKGATFNCNDVARLILTPHHDESRRNQNRLWIARNYYPELYQQQNQ